VLLTPVSWAGDARTAHAHGFEAILTKPIRRDELLETAQRLLNGPAADASPEGRTATPARRPCSTGVRVLVAEDNPVNLEVARAQLETLGCTVTAVVDGLEASTVFERERFDLVLLDCQMPRMDGLTAARRMRAIEEQAGRRQTPIVAVTANAFEADRQACLAAGMDDYLGKPFGFAALEAVVQRWTRPGIGEEDAPRRSAPAPERGASVVDLDRTVAQPAMPLQATPTLDRPLVERMRASHAHLLGRLVSTYLEYAPGALASLGDAVRRGDKPAVSRAAHSLKSSSANVGGQRLAELCRLLEAHLRHPDAGVDETSRRLADDIEAEYERLAVALSTIRQDIDSAASGLRLASEAATVGGR
jgi:CheY-like chemotaxis protein/HPt (histidine-containing phosphotransfer) domain-containing protein